MNVQYEYSEYFQRLWVIFQGNLLFLRSFSNDWFQKVNKNVKCKVAAEAFKFIQECKFMSRFYNSLSKSFNVPDYVALVFVLLQ
mmetsp:Transcript_9459/g.7224  ORF Transcript_9459/g.7224 Transcript_9459/m.7224 type:complete len:84 (-) Transcript_9459:1140-1391(-)